MKHKSQSQTKFLAFEKYIKSGGARSNLRDEATTTKLYPARQLHLPLDGVDIALASLCDHPGRSNYCSNEIRKTSGRLYLYVGRFRGQQNTRIIPEDVVFKTPAEHEQTIPTNNIEHIELYACKCVCVYLGVHLHTEIADIVRRKICLT